MKILHLVWTPRLSGAEVLAKDLAIHQRAHGIDVRIASLMPPLDDFSRFRAELDEHHIPCMFPQAAPGRFGKIAHVWHVLNSFRPDVVIAHSTIPAFYARILPTRARVIYVMHSAANDFDRKPIRIAERLLTRRATAVIGVSENNVREYKEAIGHHPMMQVIYNGVDTARFICTTQMENWSRPPQILQVGRYNPIKDQLNTVRAFAEVRRTHPEATLLLAGVIEEPAYFEAVKQLVRDLKLDDAVTVDGPRSDISQQLMASSVFAMPSVAEAHSIAFLEALATGIPVVASTIKAFAFARDFPGVHLIDTTDVSAYAQALIASLRQPRVERPLKGLTFNDTAEQYLDISRRVAMAA